MAARKLISQLWDVKIGKQSKTLLQLVVILDQLPWD